ncbi:predicted protein [Sclerotinia sclerotiorum 1980 UF-70]|uniref:Uncharacterized protein n=2 Tax=Sclerotinia sclerotiorum (strain ATCC 18683 / 1980 / Ss-1) TaxID=665079 RepID=A7EB62_SCLS1|nr:predicted protein [Sclerotinia sclerotiorum 1980 UF-70]APA08769.1 hypothetical protein sscle_04g035390 [Sclerotinia sclerotiorum 1980 UF-70]EDN99690.1 predicted protein [Sclerotinia sclerotiorum 1980 UF-70]
MTSFTDYLLPIYIIGETIRANYAYFALHTAPQITPSLIALLSETLKLAIAAIIINHSDEGLASVQKKFNKNGFKDILPYGVPAAFYLTDNLIYFTALPSTSPSFLQVCMLAKIPATAILHHLWIRKQGNSRSWISLGVLCFGLFLFNIPSGDNTKGWLVAPMAGLVIAVFSAIASIASESLTKIGSFWESQLWLYLWGVFFSIVSYPIATSMSTDRGTNSNISMTSTITIAIYFACLTSGVGLIVAAMLRKKDNLMKLVGTSISLLTIAATQYATFPELRIPGFTAWKITGGLVVMISTVFYNYFKDTSPEQANLLSQLLPASNEDINDGEFSGPEKSATALALAKLFSWVPSARPRSSSASYGLVEMRDMETEDVPPSTNKNET